MPSTLVYLVSPRSIALMAASLMLAGVSKSGSPAPRPMTLRPAALSARALSVTAMAADGLMRFSASASRAIESLQTAYSRRDCPTGPGPERQDSKADPADKHG